MVAVLSFALWEQHAASHGYSAIYTLCMLHEICSNLALRATCGLAASAMPLKSQQPTTRGL